MCVVAATAAGACSCVVLPHREACAMPVHTACDTRRAFDAWLSPGGESASDGKSLGASLASDDIDRWDDGGGRGADGEAGNA